MNRKPSVYVGDRLARIIEERKTPGRSVSGIINTIGERYEQIISLSIPEYTLDDWLWIFSKLAEHKRPGPEVVDLLVVDSTLPERVAILDCFDRYNKLFSEHGEDAIRLCGSRIKPE